MVKNYGYQNELDFVNLFNNKYYYEFDNKTKNFLKQLFGDSIDNEIKFKSWKNKMTQKADLFIKYKNNVKAISLKSGYSNSVHCEQIQEFIRYLENLKIPYKSIEKYISYHYGYKKNENGNNDFSHRLSSKEYKELYQSEIDIFNENINKTRIIVDMIDRFIIRGKNSDYDIDVLISGTIDDYVWILKYDLYDLILSKRSLEFTSPHIACMTIGPKKRCIFGDKNFKDRYLVCVRWNFIREDIVRFLSDKYFE